jgi:hypothetical protein
MTDQPGTQTQQQIPPATQQASAPPPAAKLPTQPGPMVTDKTLVKTAEQKQAEDKVTAAAATLKQAQDDAAVAAKAQAGAKPPKHYDQKALEAIVEKNYVSVEDLRKTTSNYPFRGVCKKCGWQTHQMNQADAAALVKTHAMQHWQDAVRLDSSNAA